MNLTRRGLLTGLVAFVAAPAIVRVESLMQISPKLTSGDMTVWASNQTGYQLTVNPLPFDLKLGDIFTIDNVFAINSVTKEPTDRLRQFVLTTEAKEKHRILSLYPGIIPYHPKGRYTTVDLPPMNNAKMRLVQWS